MYRSCLFVIVIIGGGLCRMKMVIDPRILKMGTITGIGIMINTIFGEVRCFVHTPLLTLFGSLSCSQYDDLPFEMVRELAVD